MQTPAFLAALCCAALCAFAPAAEEPPAGARVFEPDVVSTREATEVRLAIAPDGRRLLFGRIGAPDDPNGWDIYESVRGPDGQWTAPARAAFNSAANDFDPSFAPDGASVLFFSNRPGGEGGDDLWRVDLDPATGRYGEPVNLGATVNTPGDEWAPQLSADGKRLLFSSNGRSGAGGQDLFEAERRAGEWAPPVPLDALNTAEDDFDAAYLPDGVVVFARGDVNEGPVRLFAAQRRDAGWSPARPLPDAINCSAAVNNGPSVSPARPGRFYWSAACPEIGRGRMDIFEADAALAAGGL